MAECSAELGGGGLFQGAKRQISMESLVGRKAKTGPSLTFHKIFLIVMQIYASV